LIHFYKRVFFSKKAKKESFLKFNPEQITEQRHAQGFLRRNPLCPRMSQCALSLVYKQDKDAPDIAAFSNKTLPSSQ